MAKVAWSTELLGLLQAPPTPANYQFLNQWATREHNGGPALSDGSNNPFFTTAGAGGTVGPLKAGTFPSWNSIGVARYPSLEIGVYANALHIGREYPAIAQALRTGNPASQAGNQEFQRELTRWSGGGYSGFASIPATAGPVGPSVDQHGVMVQVGNAIAGKPLGDTGQTSFGVGDIAHGIASAPGAVVAGVEAPFKAAVSVGEFLGKLTNPAYILRALQVIAGGGLVLVGTVLLARQVALAVDLPDPGGLAAKTADAAPVAAVE